ncbi:hypothetical protein LTR56_002916 [Elasticomyces elasticus]|uniref:Uncharacterized protein n=1 Tax=Elasticomyces elasticus TaxID=574655 RepID=A0AAN8A706_9PEZI|nr:hypothetical protein LTR56_002916 [Elasticomyces elasticus]KAK3665125.1 hypothetical protein LTR22_003931 [Elasticomyces elasticus]KAK4930702.1 hypothetical protein LTR49_002790 [Elasticomyces elasticus]KAK5708408.1 hypothetical protein LTR97_000948 [Elasticomyces elasticus]KAK5726618.1 hypothetical protein LTR15_002504 [Elasticomyces elasticus]
MSANKRVVLTDKAPAPREGVLNQAIVAGGTVYCSGQIAVDPATGKVVEGGVKEHTHQIIKNLTAVLEAAGTSIDNVVKVNIFIADIKDFNAMNEVYMQYWGETKPARSCIQAQPPVAGLPVEIECIAVMP